MSIVNNLTDYTQLYVKKRPALNNRKGMLFHHDNAEPRCQRRAAKVKYKKLKATMRNLYLTHDTLRTLHQLIIIYFYFDRYKTF